MAFDTRLNATICESMVETGTVQHGPTVLAVEFSPVAFRRCKIYTGDAATDPFLGNRPQSVQTPRRNSFRTENGFFPRFLLVEKENPSGTARQPSIGIGSHQTGRAGPANNDIVFLGLKFWHLRQN